ncbi:VOC family protein [Streptomyces sp. NPDC051320]|uniref:VOC family protein n=1 Tax=Streptomyces sp. NPDC051320 TaxID=3154644 RepID=UPI003430FD65
MTEYSNGTPCWITLSAPDLDEAKDFYGQVFGWDFDDMGEEFGHYQIAKRHGEPVAGIGPHVSGYGDPAWMTFLSTNDLDAIAKKIPDAGGAVVTEPMDVPGQGRMVVASDAAGAPFGLWQGTGMHGAGLANETGTFIWNENLSTDPARAREFYQQVFGYTYEKPEGMDTSEIAEYHMVKIDGRPVGGIGSQPRMLPPGTPSFWNTYFCVDDTDQSAATIRQQGGEILVEPQDAPFGRFAVARDKGGASFAVVTPPAG